MSIDKINWLNSGLMLLSCSIAFVFPFELLLFSYAVLGPLHYLTEISWLQKRDFFSQYKYDYTILIGLSILVGFFALSSRWYSQSWIIYFTAMVLISSLLISVTKNWLHRIAAFFFSGLLCYFIKELPIAYSIFFILLPTMIHVFIFTGIFLLHGALQSRSWSAVISLGIFILCTCLFFIWPAESYIYKTASNVTQSFFHSFRLLQRELLNIFYQKNISSFDESAVKIMFRSGEGFAVTRFLAFAYTYHYLNWFSKTSIIKWHEVSKYRLIFIGILWIVSLLMFYRNYEMGFKVLFLLSFLHVALELPLNFRTINSLFIGKAK